MTGAESTALIRELSVGGALLFTQDAYPVGATLRLTLHLGPDVDEHVEAVVVRQAEEPEHVIWRHSVAVRFERRLDELTDVIESLCERQRHL